MKIRHTDDPDVCFMASDPVTLWTTGIVEYRVDRRDKKFLVTPITRDGSEGPDSKQRALICLAAVMVMVRSC
jgi:hypothetical protein